MFRQPVYSCLWLNALWRSKRCSLGTEKKWILFYYYFNFSKHRCKTHDTSSGGGSSCSWQHRLRAFLLCSRRGPQQDEAVAIIDKSVIRPPTVRFVFRAVKLVLSRRSQRSCRTSSLSVLSSNGKRRTAHAFGFGAHNIIIYCLWYSTFVREPRLVRRSPKPRSRVKNISRTAILRLFPARPSRNGVRFRFDFCDARIPFPVEKKPWWVCTCPNRWRTSIRRTWKTKCWCAVRAPCRDGVTVKR